jgi:hypothetical protein
MAPPTLDALKLETYPELGGEKSEERLEKVRNAKKEYLARVLDIPVGAVSEALNEKGSDVSNLQIRILEHIRPSFKVHEKPVVWFRIEKQSGSSSGSLNIKVDKETGARSVRTQTYRIKIEQYDGHNAWYLASYHREASDVDLKMGSAWNISIFGDSEDKTLLSTETVRCLADRAQFIFGEDGRPLSWVKTASVDVGDATEVVNLGGMGSYVREAFKTLAYAKEAYFEIGSALFAISRENRKPMREVFREGVSQ